MKESQVVTSLLKELRKSGFFWKASDKFVAGIPDIVGCIGGRFIGIEVKIDYNKPSPIQLYNIEKIRYHGGCAVVVTYSNRHKTYNIQGLSYSRKDAVEWILRLSRLHTKKNAFIESKTKTVTLYS